MLSKLQFKYSAQECDSILEQASCSINLQEMTSKIADIKSQLLHCPVSRIDVFSFGANQPCEDFWNIGLNQVDGNISSFLFHVTDGHSGTDCGAFLNRASLEYVAGSLLDKDKLARVYTQMQEENEFYHIVRRFFPKSFPPLTVPIYKEMTLKVHKFVKKTLDEHPGKIDAAENMKRALIQLDNDICELALRGVRENRRDLIHMGMSGAVSVIGRLFWSQKQSDSTVPTEIHIASVGDCGAAVFRQSEDASHLEGICLTTRHDSDNLHELERLRSQHPPQEANHLVSNHRLLGELAPLRAFGDVRYKWSIVDLLKAGSILGLPLEHTVPPHYYTPPYLTAEPDVTRHELSKRDRFLVLGTDGLWDFVKMEELTSGLQSSASNDSNLALCIAKHALGVMTAGGDTDYKKLSTTLALPTGLARYIRDDLTVMVLHFHDD